MKKPPEIFRAGARGGRPPKPTRLHKIEGTRPHRPVTRQLGEIEAAGELAHKRPPAWLSPDQRKLWHAILTDAPRGVLRRIDSVLFASYIELVDRHAKLIEAQRQLDRSQPLPFSRAAAIGGISVFNRGLSKSTAVRRRHPERGLQTLVS